MGLIRIIGWAIAFFIFVSILLDCMGGKMTPKDALKKGAEQLDPTQLQQESAKLAAEMDQKKRNACLAKVAHEQGVGNLMPACAGKTGADFESCMKQKVFGDNPGAWSAAYKKCDVGGTQGKIDHIFFSYVKTFIRGVLACPYSGFDLCFDKKPTAAQEPAAAGTPYQQCLTEAVTKMNLGAASNAACKGTTTPAAWEACMHNVLCPTPDPQSLGCAWTKSCSSKK